LFLLDPDATSDLSDAAEELDDFNVPADDESIIPPSQASSYKRRNKGPALNVSQRDDFLYISRRVPRTKNLKIKVKNEDWIAPHFLWWPSKLSQKYVLNRYFKWFEERVSFAKRALEMLNLRSILPQQLIDHYKALMRIWADTSKVFFYLVVIF
jgi:hypothetical protein